MIIHLTVQKHSLIKRCKCRCEIAAATESAEMCDFPVCFYASQHISGKRTFMVNSVLIPVILLLRESLDLFTPVLAKEMPFQEHLLGLHASL